VPKPTYTVRGLDESTWDAFAALVERNNGVFGGCWCMGFHPEGVGKETTPELNRTRKLERVRAATAHAALVFDGHECVGWCQFGAPGELPRMKSRAAYEKGVATPLCTYEALRLCPRPQDRQAPLGGHQGWPAPTASFLIADRARSVCSGVTPEHSLRPRRCRRERRVGGSRR
jgi:hypothetical protein